jgi:hypothetical protein
MMVWVQIGWRVLALFAFVQWLCGCGGGEFTTAIASDGGPRAELAADGGELLGDAGDVDAPREDLVDAAGDAEPPHVVMTSDAGDEGTRDAQGVEDAPAVLEHDGGGGPPPPPPALCCVTPCSGSQIANITCGNGPAWTCAAGSCSQDACAIGAACMWMSVCTGHVAVCP